MNCKTIIKNAAVVLMLALFLQLISCGNDKPDSESPIVDTQLEIVTTEAVPVYKDFGGADYSILCRTNCSYEFAIFEETGDIVEDAVFLRNRNVEESHNINIKPVLVDGDWANREKFLGAVSDSIHAGDDAYQLVAGYCAYIANGIINGFFLDINLLPGIDTDNVWWYGGFNDNMEVNGKLYICLGDASLTMWENLQVVFFNKKLISDYELVSPYDRIKNDDWTYDTIAEYCKVFGRDLDNNGKLDDADNWGLIFYNVRDYPVYFETPICSFDNEGYPYISLYSERFVEVYGKIHDFMNNNKYGVQFTPDVDQKLFSEDRAMFFQGPLRYAALFRGNESDFGIIPFPKYDDAQSRYYTPVVDSLSVFCIPKTVSDTELCGIVLDALCRESSSQVVPAYYEVALKTKYSRDTDSEAMLDLIRDSIWFDFGFVYSQPIAGIGTFIDIIKSGTSDVSSAYTAKEAQYQAALEKLVAYFKEME